MTSAELNLGTPMPVEEKRMHPVEFIQRSALQQEEAMRMDRIRATRGLGVAAFEGLTEATLSRVQRLGSLPSSNAMYHAYRGNFSDITPEDVYGLPENNPNVQPSSIVLAERAVYGRELTVKSLGI